MTAQEMQLRIEVFKAQMQLQAAKVTAYAATVQAAMRKIVVATIEGTTRPPMPMSLEEGIRIRNELILNGGWVAPAMNNVEVMPREHARFEYNDETLVLQFEHDHTFVPKRSIEANGLVVSLTHDGEVSLHIPFSQTVSCTVGANLTVTGHVQFGFN